MPPQAQLSSVPIPISYSFITVISTDASVVRSPALGLFLFSRGAPFCIGPLYFNEVTFRCKENCSIFSDPDQSDTKTSSPLLDISWNWYRTIIYAGPLSKTILKKFRVELVKLTPEVMKSCRDSNDMLLMSFNLASGSVLALMSNNCFHSQKDVILTRPIQTTSPGTSLPKGGLVCRGHLTLD